MFARLRRNTKCRLTGTARNVEDSIAFFVLTLFNQRSR
jgi:hypothetical protein